MPRILTRSLSAVVVAALSVLPTMLPPVASAQVADSYAALGDSYSSGNGTFSPDLDPGCYRSSYAYPALVAAQRANTDLNFVACQGATTDDIVNGQAGSLNADTDFVSVTIGGNDIGFGNLVVSCAGMWSPGCRTAVDNANARIANELPAKLDRAYAAIRAGAPHAEVVVLGYGRFFGENVSCPAANGFDAEEAGWLNGVADNLDSTIGAQAGTAGFRYASSIRSFTGHDVCAPDPYLNGHSASLADGYHPTRHGHADALAPAVRRVIG